MHRKKLLWVAALETAASLAAGLVLAASPAGATARGDIRDGAPVTDFVNAGLPQWNFAEPRVGGKKRLTCWPSDAWPNGSQHTGNKPKAWPNAGSGCAAAGWRFPTYWTTKTCRSNDFRVGYFLYFPHDGFTGGGHKHDWEHIVMVWRKNGNSWTRDHLKLSKHGGYNNISWKKAESWNDDRRSAGKGRVFPRIFVGWGKHAMHNNQGGLTDEASNNVGTSYSLEFRRADHPVWSSDWLVDTRGGTDIANKIDGAKWGNATGTPNHANLCG
jgi:hypothetical protein